MIKSNMNTELHNYIHLNKKFIHSANIQERDNFYTFQKHSHKNIEIYYFINGNAKMDIGSETIIAKPGNIILILPNIVHSFYLDSEKKCEFLHFHFDASDLTSFLIEENNIKIDLLSLMNSIKYYYKLNADNNMISLLYSIYRESNDTNVFSKTFSNLHLIELLIYIIKKEEMTSFLLSPKYEIKPRYVQLAFEYIKIHYSEKILLCDIANHLNISSRYLSKIFFETTNLTVLNYLNIYRVNQAINLMITTNDSLTDISLNVGLGTIQHFSKLFKNIIGITPGKYKQSLLK